MTLEHFQLRDTEIRIAIDNTCAEAWIRRGASPDDRAHQELTRVWDALEGSGCSLRVIGVDTDHCAADALSRGDDLSDEDKDRVSNSWKVLSEWLDRAEMAEHSPTRKRPRGVEM